MRVLVTGIDGFVGSHLAEHLLGVPGVDLHGTVLPDSGSPNIDHLRPRVKLRTCDILDASRVEEIFHDVRPERVIHLAAQPFVPASVQDPRGTLQTNFTGGMTVLEAARKLRDRDGGGPAVLIVSTGEVYGGVAPSRQPIGEEEPLHPGNPYAASKAALDLTAQMYAATYGLDVVVARPFNHAGPRQSPSFVTSDFGRRFAEVAAGTRAATINVGNVTARRDFTDVRDVVRAYWALFDRHSRECVYNVCSGTGVAVGEIIDLYQEIAGVRVSVVTDAHRLRPYDIPSLVGNNRRLTADTGWSPAIPLRQTLADVFQYWRRAIAPA